MEQCVSQVIGIDDDRLEQARSWVLEALRKRSLILAEQEVTFSLRGTANRWMLDTRLLLLDPVAMEHIAILFWTRMRERSEFQLACLEMTGIPLLVAFQAHGLAIGRPVNGVIVRKERKSNGRMRAIEGELNNLPIVFLDDLVNSGDSVGKAQVVLQEQGRTIEQVWALVDYENRRGREKIENLGATIAAEYTLSELGNVRLKSSSLETIGNPFETVWRFHHPDHRYYHMVPKSTPVLDDELLYFGSDAGMFFAIDQKNGDLCWSFNTKRSGAKGIWSSPIVNGDSVIFGAYNGNVYALDRKSGDIRWQFQEADFVGSSPAFAPEAGVIAIGLEHTLRHQKGSIVGLDSESGERVWEFPTRDFVHGSPLYVPDTNAFIVGSNDNDCVCLDARTGQLRWMFQTRGAVKSRAAFAPQRGLVIFGCFDHFIYGIDLLTGNQTWKTATEGIVYSEPLIIGGRVYVNCTDKQMYVLDLESGSILHRWDANSKLFSSPAQIGNKVYLGTNAGVVVEYDPATDKVTGRCQLPERVTNKIVYGSKSGLLFVSTNDNQIFALRRSGLPQD